MEQRQCSSCTFLNHHALKYCEMCENSLEEEKKTVVDPIMTQSAAWENENRKNEKEISAFNSASSIDGIFDVLRTALSNERVPFRLCSPCPHITQMGFEGAGWTCGYRNIQMLCVSMMQDPVYKNVLFGGTGEVPEVYGLQSWIEAAWKEGFDEEGCNHFSGSLLGKSSWIGTTECAALLRYFGIRARIVDFVLKSEERVQAVDAEEEQISVLKKQKTCESDSGPAIGGLKGSDGVWKASDGRWSSSDEECDFIDLPSYNVDSGKPGPSSSDPKKSGRAKSKKGDVTAIGRSIGSWVLQYFGEADASANSSVVLPLYFQHQGHSRTIVGYQGRNKTANAVESLLIFDPMGDGKKLLANLRNGSYGWKMQLKRGLHTLWRNEYEIVFIEPGLMTMQEKEDSKVLSPIRIECVA